MVSQLTVLVLYDAKGRSIESMAQAVAEGVEASGVASPSLKTIEEASRDDLLAADGLILGSPNWSGITGSFKQWLDDQGDLWEELALAGRPGAAFTTGTGRHSGLETTLGQLIHWMRPAAWSCWAAVVGADAHLRVVLRGDGGGRPSPRTIWRRQGTGNAGGRVHSAVEDSLVLNCNAGRTADALPKPAAGLQASVRGWTRGPWVKCAA